MFTGHRKLVALLVAALVAPLCDVARAADSVPEPARKIPAALRTPGPDARAGEDLDRGLANPPDACRPWTYWFWCGPLSREGITADLEAMQRVGIGGVFIIDTNAGRIMSDPWRDMWKHTVAEAARTGIQINMHQSTGWCGSSGPWVSPEQSMQHVIWSETTIEGGRRWEGILPAPLAGAKRIPYYRDIAVLAFPTPQSERTAMGDARPRWTSSAGGTELPIVLAPPAAGKPAWIQVAFDRPFHACGLEITAAWDGGAAAPGTCTLEASDDAAAFTPLGEFPLKAANREPFSVTAAHRFSPVARRCYRLTYKQAGTRADKTPAPLTIQKMNLHGRLRIESLREKTLEIFCPHSLSSIETDFPRDSFIRLFVKPSARYPAAPRDFLLPRDRVVNLSGQMDKDGRLIWEAPPGSWTVMRFGHTPTGQRCHFSGGLDCDKLSKEALDAHFAAMIGKLIADAPDAAGKTLAATFIESWESGGQNWTVRMPEEFRRRRGYDILPLLPIFSGRILDNMEVSERFLWDLRQTVSDMICDYYAGHMRELAHRHGLRLWIEAYEGPLDDLTYAGRADEPVCEFWGHGGRIGPGSWTSGCRIPPKQASSAAHVYGPKIVGAEAFTAGAGWELCPALLKVTGDSAFCSGVNRLIIVRNELVPWAKQPPMRMGDLFHFGTYHQRQQPWWELSRAYHQYVARCQFLLRQGLFVADVCRLLPEACPGTPLDAYPPAQRVYDYDCCPPEVALTRMSVKDGRICLPDGMSYRLLALHPSETMTPALLRKITELVREGATMLGEAPQKSPSLSDYPACDAEVAKLARELWGDCDGQNAKERVFGKGKVLCGMTPEAALGAMGVPPDFQGPREVDYIHRRIGETEIYFVASASKQRVSATCRFRVEGKQPELWFPDSGRNELPALYQVQNGCTLLPLQFDEEGSVFVVFRQPTRADTVVSVALEGKIVCDLSKPEASSVTQPVRVTRGDRGPAAMSPAQSGRYTLTTAAGRTVNVEVPDLPSPLTIEGPWSVRFAKGWGAPDEVRLAKLISWHEHDDPGVKYFSGTAVYSTAFRVLPGLRGDGRRLFLDLGTVAVIAAVKLNGKDLGGLWHSPFRTEVTEAIQEGNNTLEVTVANLAMNRAIGDWRLPNPEIPEDWLREGGGPSKNGRYTAYRNKISPDTPLRPSGLIGPVRITVTQSKEIQ